MNQKKSESLHVHFLGHIHSYSEFLLALVKPNVIRLALQSVFAKVSELHSQ